MEDYYNLKYNNLKEKIEVLLNSELNFIDNDLTNFIISKALEYDNENDFYNFIKENESEFKFDTVIKIYYNVKNFHPNNLNENNNKEKENVLNDTETIINDKKYSLKLNSNSRSRSVNKIKKIKKIKVNKITKIKIIKFYYSGILVKIKRENYKYNGFIYKNEIPKNFINFNDLKIQEQNKFLNKKYYAKIIKIENYNNNKKIYLSMKNIDYINNKNNNIKNNKENLEYGAITGIKLEDFNDKYISKTYEDPWEKNRIDRVNNKTSIKKSINDLKEEYLDIEISKREPEFLKGQTSKTGVRLSPVKLIKNEDGFLQKEVLNTIKLTKERIIKREQEKRKMNKNVPKNWNKILDDPLMGNSNKIMSIEKKKFINNKETYNHNFNYNKNTYENKDDLKIEKENLPIFKYKKEFLKEIKENKVLIIIGETGSGKTTQLTQYLYENGYCKYGKKIGCTQPRRIATRSVAKRVCEEMNVKLGEEVGYTIRFEDYTSKNTKIKYMTDGMLLREILIDKNLENYSVIILDEAHERTINTDVLMGLLKKTIQNRNDLKLIITSATLDSEKFSEYFFNCNTFKIPGRNFPVKIYFTKEPEVDYFDSSINYVLEIHLKEPKGDILLFLTGEEEINSACQIINEKLSKLKDLSELICLPIYSALPTDKQNKILEPTPEGKRKCIIATNIAEASLTIDGIYYVIDPGFCKIKCFNPKTCMDSLVISPISQASANQRSGRAGRTGPGKCYRLYTEDSYLNEMLPNTLPEIKRNNLSNTVLILKAMGINDIINFDFIDKPPKQNLISALENLFYLGALNEQGKLKELGYKMAEFPLDPELSKILLTSIDLKCTNEIITIISLINVQNIFYKPKEKQHLADEKRIKFNQIEGDHITLLKIYDTWKNNNFSSLWCQDNFIHFRNLKRAKDIRNQLIMIFNKVNIPILSCKGNYNLIRKSICSGLFTKVAKKDIKEGYKTLIDNQKVFIHPTSALFNKNPEWIVFNELIFTSKEYMRRITTIEPKWLIEISPKWFQELDLKKSNLKDGIKLPDYGKNKIKLATQTLNLEEIYKNN